jgi:hypothetical protein
MLGDGGSAPLLSGFLRRPAVPVALWEGCGLLDGFSGSSLADVFAGAAVDWLCAGFAASYVAAARTERTARPVSLLLSCVPVAAVLLGCGGFRVLMARSATTVPARSPSTRLGSGAAPTRPSSAGVLRRGDNASGATACGRPTFPKGMLTGAAGADGVWISVAGAAAPAARARGRCLPT